MIVPEKEVSWKIEHEILFNHSGIRPNIPRVKLVSPEEKSVQTYMNQLSGHNKTGLPSNTA